MHTRNSLRQQILDRRNRLSSKERSEKSSIITEKLLTHKQIDKSDTIFCYINYKTEVETKGLISKLLSKGKKVAVPLTLEKEKQLLAVTISNIDTDLEPGYCTILEPRKELVTNASISPSKIDTIILPGSVFDHHGGRMGYGGGFYDRFIAYWAPKALRVGICFDIQLVDELPLEPHDKKMNYIITENNFIKNKGKRLGNEENRNFYR